MGEPNLSKSIGVREDRRQAYFQQVGIKGKRKDRNSGMNFDRLLQFLTRWK